jgi:D-alanyl-lipoteichoic acid acyltransferase DltB (MBOAT superfamily)
MPFTSLDFAIFFGIVLVLNWRLKQVPRLYPKALLIFNLVFYALGAPKFLPLLIVVAYLNWKTASLITPNTSALRSKIYLWADITLNLGILAFFKYFDFILTTLEDLGFLLHEGLFALPEIIYPVGLSFFTFQGLSLALDQYRDPSLKSPSFLESLVFVSFFPTVLSGPIQRLENFLPQLKRSRVTPEDYSLAITLILSGLFKKVALSSYLSEFVVRGPFQVPEQYSGIGILGAIYGYSAQIYLDFSGYSDLALGVGLLLGFNVGENFRSPYLSTNIRDFWRRWHISLSTWLKDYLYISLGGSRKGSTTLNLIITQTLGGLWHGAHLRYLIWGLAHGLWLSITHAYLTIKKKRQEASGAIGFKKWQLPKKTLTSPRFKKFLAIFFTFNFVTFLWVLFRAESMSRASEIYLSLVDFTRPGQGSPLLGWLIVGLTLFGQKMGGQIKDFFTKFQNRLSLPLLSLWCAFWVIIILRLGPEGILPFIYFQY